MKELNFITIGSVPFFPFINFSAKQLMKIYPNCRFFIYDWGFTQHQRNILNSYPISEVIDWRDNIDKENGYKTIIKEFNIYLPPESLERQRRSEYLYKQKPICILDCAKRIQENLIFLDGDAFLINSIDELFSQDFDIGVTMRPKEEIEIGKKKGLKIEVNVGVIIFKLKTKLMKIFVQEWIHQTNIIKTVFSEQTAIIKLIEKDNNGIFNNYYNTGIIKLEDNILKVKTFPCSIYNIYNAEKGFDISKSKVIHLKGNRATKGFGNNVNALKASKIYLKNIITTYKLRCFFKKFSRIFPNFLIKQINKILKLKIEFIALFINEQNKIEKIRKKILNILINYI